MAATIDTRKKLQRNKVYEIIWKIEMFKNLPTTGVIGVNLNLDGVLVPVLISKKNKTVQIQHSSYMCAVSILNKQMKPFKYNETTGEKLVNWFKLDDITLWPSLCVNSSLTLQIEIYNYYTGLDRIEKSELIVETCATVVNCDTTITQPRQTVAIPILEKVYHFHFCLDEGSMTVQSKSFSEDEFVCFTRNTRKKQQYSLSKTSDTLKLQDTSKNILTLSTYYKTTINSNGNKLKETEKTTSSSVTEQNLPKFDTSIWEPLFASKKFADFLILVQGVPVMAHKIILANRCSFWKTPPAKNQNTQTKTVDLETISDYVEERFDWDTMNVLLEFLYTNRIPKVITEKLVHMAAAYGVADLTLICEQTLIKQTTIENAVWLLSLSKLSELGDLEQHTVSVIKANIRGPSGMKLFKELMAFSPDLAYDILK